MEGLGPRGSWAKGWGVGRGVEGGSEMSAHWGSPEGFFLGWHTCPRVPAPGSGLRMAHCARDGPTGAQGRVVVLGASADSCQCLQPTGGSLELGVGVSLSSTIILSGTKEGGARAPQPQPRWNPGTGQRRVAPPRSVAVGLTAEWVGLLASSSLELLQEIVWRGGRAPGTCTPRLLFVLKSLPLCLGGMHRVPFSSSLLHAFLIIPDANRAEP